jgi:hypothetical protein
MTESETTPPRRGLDLTFNIGHLLVIVTVIAGLVGSHYVSGYRLDLLEKKFDRVEAKLDGFAPLITSAALAEHRLGELERRLAQMERR